MRREMMAWENNCFDDDQDDNLDQIWIELNDYHKIFLLDGILIRDIYYLDHNYVRAVKKSFTIMEASEIANKLAIDFNKEKYDLEQFRQGLDVELEHGKVNPITNVTDDDPLLTGKIALAHLNEFPDYYTRLSKLEEEAKNYWSKK